jgi:hypothetical protein
MATTALKARRLRGGRRYFARRRRETDELVALIRSGTACELGHHHFDLSGYGERSARLRGAHRRLLLDAFERAREAAAHARQPTQVFVQLATPENCGEDALYYHSQSVGDVGFPYRYPNFRWNTTVPGHVREAVAGQRLRIGHSSFNGSDFWVLVDPDDPGLSV